MEEKRRFTRIAYQSTGKAKINDIVYNVEVHDLSLKGVLFKIDAPKHDVKQGDEGKLDIFLSDDITVSLNIKVARIDGNNIGVVSTSIDVDSITHIRTMCEYNMSPNGLIDRDLAELVR